MALLTPTGQSSRAGTLPLLLISIVSTLGAAGMQKPREPQPALEHQVKAAFLYNFAKFVEWPTQGRGEPIVLCVLGKDAVAPALDHAVSGKTIEGRALETRRCNKAAELQSCHVLFISSSEERRVKEILDALGNSSVLTVAEIKHFAQRGGIINFTRAGKKLGLEINPDAASRAGLKISSKLLKLASIVKDEQAGGQ